LPEGYRRAKSSQGRYSLRVSEPKPNRIRGRVIASGDQLSKKLLLSYVVILALSMSLVPYAIDPFLPAFPEIAIYFGVPNGTVQASPLVSR